MPIDITNGAIIVVSFPHFINALVSRRVTFGAITVSKLSHNSNADCPMAIPSIVTLTIAFLHSGVLNEFMSRV